GNGPVVDARRRRVGPGWTGRVVDRDLAEEGHAAHHHDADVAGALDDLVAGGPEPDLAGDVVVLDRDGGGGRRAEGGTAGGTGQHEDEGLVQLHQGVVQDGDGDRLRYVAGVEGHGPHGGGVVGARQRAVVAGRVGDRDVARQVGAR